LQTIELPTTFPYTMHLGGLVMPLHGLLEFIGIFVAFRYYMWLKKTNGDTVAETNRMLVVAAAAFGAVLGGRLLGSLENVPAWFAAPSPWLYFYGNKTLVGGLLGGLASVELVKKIIGERQHTGDLLTYPLILGMMIGRIGCFSAGIYEETYGVRTGLPWGMNLGDGLQRHPVALYEILFLAVTWLGLAGMQKYYVLQQGALFRLFLISYLLFRFLLDFIKPGWRYCFGLGTIQLSCLAGLCYYYRYLLRQGLSIILKKNYAS
jgi:phosphatidylglycerol:prolipoprotein diacylglycerol transferase